MNAFVQSERGVSVEDRDDLLSDDAPRIHPRIDEMNRAPGHVNAVVQRLFPGFKAREGRQ